MKFKIIKNKTGMSPTISAIILVAVTITYALVASSWLGQMTVSIMSLEELKITNCEWSQDNSYADLTIKNIGTQAATLSTVQINGEITDDFEIVEGNIRVNPGRSTTLRINQSFSQSTKYDFKLTTKRQTPVTYVSIAQPISETSNEAAIHYINRISNIDESSDKGSHSNFAHQGGNNDLFDTITEEDLGAGLLNVLQIVENDGSNVDGNSNYGNKFNFVNVQDKNPDNDYMTLQEENLGIGSAGYPSIRSKTHSSESSGTTRHNVKLPDTIESGDTLLVVFVCDDNEQITWEKEGIEWNVIYEEDAGGSGPTMSIAWKKATGKEDGTTITIETNSNEESTHIAYSIQDAKDPTVTPPEASVEASGYSNCPDPITLSPSGGSNSYLWLAIYGSDKSKTALDYPDEYQNNRETYKSSKYSSGCAIGAATRKYTAAYDDTRDFKIKHSEEWEATTVVIYPEQSFDDYELDFEYQWTNADFDETSEEVCIYVETASQDGENLVAYEWTGESWQKLGILSSDGWNNFTASFLTGSSYTINIRDENKSNEITQSSWNIDCIITNCSSIETNYEADLEVQFTDINVGNNYEQICIRMGSATAEPLDVYIWNDGTWEILASNLVQNQWNNMTRTITKNTVTLRFLGTLETNDAIQDNWEIYSTLLYAPE